MTLKSLFLYALPIVAGLAITSCTQPTSETNTADNGKAVQAAAKPVNMGALKIAYVNNDSLLMNSEMRSDMEEQLIEETNVLENQFRSQYEKFEQDYMDAQKQASMLSASELERMKNILAQREYELQTKKQQLDEQLYSSQERLNQKFVKELRAFLDDYAANEGYQIIYGYNGLGNVLYMDEQFNITDIVVDSLNRKYRADKEKESAETAEK